MMSDNTRNPSSSEDDVAGPSASQLRNRERMRQRRTSFFNAKAMASVVYFDPLARAEETQGKNKIRLLTLTSLIGIMITLGSAFVGIYVFFMIRKSQEITNIELHKMRKELPTLKTKVRNADKSFHDAMDKRLLWGEVENIVKEATSENNKLASQLNDTTAGYRVQTQREYERHLQTLFRTKEIKLEAENNAWELINTIRNNYAEYSKLRHYQVYDFATVWMKTWKRWINEAKKENCNDYSRYHGSKVVISINHRKTFKVCDQGSVGLVIQRRMSRYESFDRNWFDYVRGFGELYEDYWIGLQSLYELAFQRVYWLRIDFEDFYNNKAYIVYREFLVLSEADSYAIKVNNYYGNAGTSLPLNVWMKFSTKDKDFTAGKCPTTYRSGWWFDNCRNLNANLNGIYTEPSKGDPFNETGIYWKSWRTFAPLKRVEMKLQMKRRRIDYY